MFFINIIQEYFLILKFKILGFYKTTPEHYKVGKKGDILMIVGFNENWNFLNTIAESLNIKGYRIHFPTFKTHATIEECTSLIIKYIEDFQLNDLVIVTHSKGGLIARNLLLSSDDKIRNIIEIAAPNNGTIFGNLIFHNLRELKPKSRQLQILDNFKTSKIINIYPKFDNHVIPNSSLFLEGAKNVGIDIVGHTRILESKELLTELDKIL